MPPPDISTLLQDFDLWLSSGDTCGECLLEDRFAAVSSGGICRE